MKYFEAGIIVNTQGVKGEIRVIPSIDDISRFLSLKKCYLPINSQLVRYDIERCRFHKQFVLVKLKGVDDMSTAELLKGLSLKIDETDVPPLDEDEYFVGDLCGLLVLSEDNEVIGELSDVIQTAAHDIYVIDDPKSKSGKLLVPATKEFILSVDVASKRMIIRIMDGLRDLK